MLGAALPSVRKQVTTDQVARYARAAGDENPLHLDPEFAARGPFGRVVAHGMLAFAFMSEMMTREYGLAWLETGRLKVRFRAPFAPGDDLTVEGQVTRVVAAGDGQEVECSLTCRNEQGDEVVSGQAWVRLQTKQGPEGDARP